MKYLIVLILATVAVGCSSLKGGSKRPAEVVASCFSDGENQSTMCKAQRINEEGLTVTTRCIGSQNQEAKQGLRGKCVEKICSEGSNTECQTRGEFAVLEQYAELVTSKMFEGEDHPKSHSKKKSTARKTPPPTKPAAVVLTKKEQAAPAPVANAAAKQAVVEEPAAEVQLTLRPSKRSIASITPPIEEGYKRVCVSKNDFGAPHNLRGKCATRNCTNGKCNYQGRKEMFEWVSANES